MHESHARAESLIAKERVEGISPAEQEWLTVHLRECGQCSASVEATQQALRSLLSLQVTAPRGLAARTQFRVRLRAQEMRSTRQPRWRLIHPISGALTTAGAATTLNVCRGLASIWPRAR